MFCVLKRTAKVGIFWEKIRDKMFRKIFFLSSFFLNLFLQVLLPRIILMMIDTEKVFEKLENEDLELAIQFLFEQIKQSSSKKEWYSNALILWNALKKSKDNSLKAFGIKGEQERIMDNCVQLLHKIEDFQDKQDSLEKEKEIDTLKNNLAKLEKQKQVLQTQEQTEKKAIFDIQQTIKEILAEKVSLEKNLSDEKLLLEEEKKLKLKQNKLAQNLEKLNTEIEELRQKTQISEKEKTQLTEEFAKLREAKKIAQQNLEKGQNSLIRLNTELKSLKTETQKVKVQIQDTKPKKQSQNYTETLKNTSFEMIAVEGGKFLFQGKKPVILGNFYIGKYPVTQKLYEVVMGKNPSHFSGCPDCPVEQVSWFMAMEFIEKLNTLTGQNYLLPTEVQWEYAAKGGQKSKGCKYAGSTDIKKVA